MDSTLFKHLPPANLRLRPEFILASGLFSGYAPFSPGTFGSIAFLILWFFLTGSGLLVSLWSQILCIVIVTVAGFFVTECCLARLFPDREQVTPHRKIDPQFIVIDEWAGMAVSLLAVNRSDVIWPVLALLLFRFFDILKPGPVRTLEGLPGSAGIMLDDVLAGVFALLCLQIMAFVLG